MNDHAAYDAWLAETAQRIAELAGRIESACADCKSPTSRPALDTCRDLHHRQADATLGTRDADCGCCVIVDATALSLLRDLAGDLRAEREQMDSAIASAAAWVADGIGYPVQVAMPDHPVPSGLWDALVDHVHRDVEGKWHGGELTRDEVECWLFAEAGDQQ